jgi:FAD/FMN-containing dehydrogenase
MTTTLDNRLARELAERLSGPVISPQAHGYDEARAIHNGLVDRRPAVIVRSRTTRDVVAALAYARRAGLEVSVRGGGHNVAGRAVTDGGVMISLADMKKIAVDPARATVAAQGGVTWGELNAAAGAHGLGVTGGVVSTTGIAGYTLGGGLGWLMAKHGLAADNLLAVELVTAAGEVLDVDAVSHPDLFWALRGGGGNFGVATSFTYRLHEVGTVTGGLIAHPIEAAPELLRFYRDAVADVSDDQTVFAGLVHAPDGSGAKVAALVVFHAGHPEAGRTRAGAVHGLRIAADGPGRSAPVPGDEHAARRRVPRRCAQLLALELHPRPAGRAHRHGRRAVCSRSLSDDVDLVRALPRRRDPGRAE